MQKLGLLLPITPQSELNLLTALESGRYDVGSVVYHEAFITYFLDEAEAKNVCANHNFHPALIIDMGEVDACVPS